MSRRELTVPEASVLAYKRRQLVFVENTWGEQRLEEACGRRGLCLLGRERPASGSLGFSTCPEERQRFSAPGAHTSPPHSHPRHGPTEMLLWGGRDRILQREGQTVPSAHVCFTPSEA